MDAIYEFGPFRLEVGERRLLKDGEPVRLRAKVFDTLCALAARPGRLVTKDELMRIVWPDSVVEENNLAHNITALRKLLGAGCVETVSGKGYRFLATVRPAAPEPQQSREPRLAAVPRLFERERQMRDLDACLAAALEGRRQVVCIPGEAGAGKTTLLNAFLRSARSRPDVRIGRGHCLEHCGEPEPYMPVLEAIGQLCREPQDREVVDVLARHAPTWLLHLPWLFAPERRAELEQRALGATRERMLREFAEAAERLAARRPLILALDDLHWSDQSTLALLEMLARRDEPACLLLLATYRPADAARAGHPLEAMTQSLKLRGGCRVVQPDLLTSEGVRKLMGADLPGLDVTPELAAAVRRRTGGNPLFVVALADHWREAGKVSAGAIPDSLRAMIQQKTDALSEAERALLEAASAAGEEFVAAVAAASLGWPEEDAERVCAALARSGGFLAESGPLERPDGSVAARFRFVHAMYREVVYAGVPAGRRMKWHRAIGVELEQFYGGQAAAHAGELAGHFLEGRDPGRAVPYLRQAAEQAVQRSAYREAARLLRRGLDLIEARAEGPERWGDEMTYCALLAPAALAVEGLASAEASRCFRRARELGYRLGRTEEMYALLFHEATMHEMRGEYRRAEEILHERARLPKSSHEIAVRVDSDTLMACSLFHQGEFSRAMERAENGVRLYDPREHVQLIARYGENPVVACNGWAALSLWCLGYPDQAAARAQTAVRLAEAPDHCFSLASAIAKAAQVGQLRRDVAATRDLAAQTVRLAQEHGYLYDGAFARALLGWARAAEGAPRDGIALLRDGINELRHIGAHMDLPYLLALLAEAQSEAGDPAAALDTVSEALSLVRNSRTFFYEAELYRLKGVLAPHSRRGAEDEAEANLRQALEVALRQQALSLDLRATADLCRLLRRRGRAEEGEQALAAVCERFREGFDTADWKDARALLATASCDGPGRRPRLRQTRSGG